MDEEFDKFFDEAFENEFYSYGERQVATKPENKRDYIERDREEGHIKLWNDKFSENEIFSTNQFRPRFRMKKPLYMRIVDRLSNEIPFF